MPNTNTELLATSNPNYIKRRLTAAAVGFATLISGGVIMAEMFHGSGKKDTSSEPTPAQIAEGRAQLEQLTTRYPNRVVAVEPDPQHPELEQVTVKMAGTHHNISDIGAVINPDQDWTSAAAKAETYNDGSEITQPNQEITVDVDPATRFIVPNPALTDSQGQSG